MFIIFLYVAYSLLIIAMAYSTWKTEALAGRTESETSGVSIVPIIPLFPMLAWAFTWLANKYISENSFTISFYLHLLLCLFSTFIILRGIYVIKNSMK